MFRFKAAQTSAVADIATRQHWADAAAKNASSEHQTFTWPPLRTEN